MKQFHDRYRSINSGYDVAFVDSGASMSIHPSDIQGVTTGG